MKFSLKKMMAKIGFMPIAEHADKVSDMGHQVSVLREVAIEKGVHVYDGPITLNQMDFGESVVLLGSGRMFDCRFLGNARLHIASLPGDPCHISNCIFAVPKPREDDPADDLHAKLLAEFNDTAIADRVMRVIKGERG
jgi:hypothetical protein